MTLFLPYFIFARYGRITAVFRCKWSNKHYQFNLCVFLFRLKPGTKSVIWNAKCVLGKKEKKLSWTKVLYCGKSDVMTNKIINWSICHHGTLILRSQFCPSKSQSTPRIFILFMTSLLCSAHPLSLHTHTLSLTHEAAAVRAAGLYYSLEVGVIEMWFMLTFILFVIVIYASFSIYFT